ncbi:hypothetical protein Bca52824_025985 [Brassica carinata]|uniref:RRM domain-containing protein n=1 Tax=Brassica carinata TaxID=52824 RepID=A0A8X7SHR2_BRACI|nr:hypothetical protein Bca52824_065963 [Brassica carinata]KAG2306237.1 hypothetical protein Bca52824_025985 [Brassica carinata]
MAYWWWWWREPSIYEMAEAGYTLLYVGDIEPTVSDSVLFDAFSQASQASSVRVCGDSITGRSLGYGYVSFHHSRDGNF